MTRQFKHLAIGAALIFLIGVSANIAQAKSRQSLSTTKTIPALCDGDLTQASSISMHSTDHSRLELARAFKAHLETTGQNSAVIGSIYKASMRSGVDFDLLLLKGIMESGLGRYTVATGSTARGLFQYIEPTWLTLMKRYGAELGYPNYAAAISYTKGTSHAYIKNKNKYLKAEILALRYDNDTSAMMKALQVKEETQTLRNFKGSKVTATDHYISHMLGLPLTKELYSLRKRGSVFAVARLGNAQMREAAKLNRPFFYKGKTALTARDVYKRFEARVNRELKNIHNIENKGKNAICTAAKAKYQPPV